MTFAPEASGGCSASQGIASNPISNPVNKSHRQLRNKAQQCQQEFDLELDSLPILRHPPTVAWAQGNCVSLIVARPQVPAAAAKISSVHPASAASCLEQRSLVEAAEAGRSPIVATGADASEYLASRGYILIHLPLRPTAFFAWFLDREAGARLARLAAAFQSSAAQRFGAAAVLQPCEHLRRPLHVTAKYFAAGEDPRAYASRADVAAAVGRATDIRVTGLLLRPGSTLVARVELSPSSQLALWENEPTERECRGRCHLPQSCPLLPRGSRAHITLATAAGTRPVQAGFDLLSALARMLGGCCNAASAVTQPTRLGAVTYFGDDNRSPSLCYLTLAEPVVAPALFAGYY